MGPGLIVESFFLVVARLHISTFKGAYAAQKTKQIKGTDGKRRTNTERKKEKKKTRKDEPTTCLGLIDNDAIQLTHSASK